MSASSQPSTSLAPWYRDGLCFACTQCGACCSGAPGYVWVSLGDTEAIAAHLDLEPAAFAARHVRRVHGGLSLREKPGGDCEFLQRLDDGKTRCQIHPVRPTQCRTWPFWKSNVTSQRAWAATARDCPGIDHGPLHPLPEIESALKQNGDLPL